MKFASIASGSSGNCLFLECGEQRFLIDAGISCKRITEGLKSFGIDPSTLNGIFITHEHTDHINGLSVFLKKNSVPVYGTRGTLMGIVTSKGGDSINTENFYEVDADRSFKIGDVTVTPYAISHDAKEPTGYTFKWNDQKFGMATDLGIYDEYTIHHLKNSDILYVEANHDIAMLEVGSYPFYLKQRITGNRGHLSNENGGKLALSSIGDHTKHVILGHLSHENNFPDLALKTVDYILKEKLGPELPFTLDIASRSEISRLYKI